MRTDLFDFDLPPERIALRPASPRDAARLLVVRPGAAPEFDDRGVRDLPELLRPGDAMVVNDTRVIPARLVGRRIGRGDSAPKIEATLHRRLDGSRWRAFVKPAKRLEAGDVVRFGEEGEVCFLGQLDATVEAKGEGGEVTLAFAFHGAVLDQAIEERGAMPLPPYIAARRASGRIVAVGSTSLRLLENAADRDGMLCPFAGETALFITPGYRFRAVDVLMTNFHLPRSTLFMLVAAFSGLDTMQRAYAHAIAGDYRFYSYGDACLLFRATG